MKKLFLAPCVLCLLVLVLSSPTKAGNTPAFKQVKKTLKRELPITYRPWLKPEVLEGVDVAEAEEIVADFGDELSDLQYLMTRGSFAYFVSLGTEEARNNYLNGPFWNAFRVRGHTDPRSEYLGRIAYAKKYFGDRNGDISGSDRAKLMIRLGMPDKVGFYNERRPWVDLGQMPNICPEFQRLEFWYYSGFEFEGAPLGDAMFMFFGEAARLWRPGQEFWDDANVSISESGCMDHQQILATVAKTVETIGHGGEKIEQYLALPDPMDMEGAMDRLPVLPLGEKEQLSAEFSFKAEHVKDVFANGEWHYSGRARVEFRFSVPVEELVANSTGGYSVGIVFELYAEDGELLGSDISVTPYEVKDGMYVASMPFKAWPGKYYATVKVYDAVAKMMRGEERAHLRKIEFVVHERTAGEDR